MNEPAEDANVELVRNMFERLHGGDPGALEGMLTEESVARFQDRTCRGSREIIAYFEQTFVAIPDWSVELIAIAGHGENVLMRYQITGTHEGPLAGIAGSGKRVAIDGFEHFVIRGGKLVATFSISDQIQFARQIGMMPPDGSLPDRAMKAAFKARVKLAGLRKR